MAPAASLNHVARNRIVELLGCAVTLLLWYPCVLASVDSHNVNLSKEKMDGLQALWEAFSVNAPDPDKYLHNWRNSTHPCGFSSPKIFGQWPNTSIGHLGEEMDSNAWIGLTCHFHNDTDYTWVNGVTVTRLWSQDIVRPSPLKNLEDPGLVGVVPPEVSKLRNLERINLHQNSLSGNFPFSSLINMSNLTYLNLNGNNFEGTIAEDAFQNLRQLQELALSSNKFTGRAPINVSNILQLKKLDLSSNEFTGEAPDVSNLSNLESLYLSDNNFTGQAPDVSNLSMLMNLNMSWNAFTGQAPNLSKLTQLSDL
ncbi:hypothetical protein M758_10G007900 [Ceratodon purpureus]|nr:hypothetical protein M758_10G007900 [Ceratodon purpureus]